MSQESLEQQKQEKIQFLNSIGQEHLVQEIDKFSAADQAAFFAQVMPEYISYTEYLSSEIGKELIAIPHSSIVLSHHLGTLSY